jgi:hypothetical protein
MNKSIFISDGDLLDKLSILQIKLKFIEDPNKIVNINKEYLYIQTQTQDLLNNTKIISLYNDLKEINTKLWNIEDAIRIKESKKEFDQEFIRLARSVYFTNDQRANIKKQINTVTESEFIEEKSYKNY